MKLNLNQIAAGHTAHHLRWPPRTLPRLAEQLAEGARGDAGEVTADLNLKLVEGEVEIQGRIRALITIPCSLCLEPVDIELDEEFTAVQAPTAHERGLGVDIHLTGAEMDVNFFEGDEIDLAELVEEQVLLMMPPAETCRDDCKGLCASCGANLNEGECGCVSDDVTHPFAAMKALLKDS